MLARDISSRTGPAKTANVPFERIYSPLEIDQIDEIGKQRRFGAGKIPDIRSLAEILRTIGRLVDGQAGQLVKIYKDARRIVFEFTDNQGKAHNETMTIPDLHRLQKNFYEKRGAPVGADPWQNRR
jgi:hypothetical protein